MAGGRACKSNVRERREAERRMKALEKRQKKEEKRKEERGGENGPQPTAPAGGARWRPERKSVALDGLPVRDAGHPGGERLNLEARVRTRWRRTQVAKGEVCKTSLHRFESGRRPSTT